MAEIINDLTTGGIDAALSAEQGKVLNKKIENLDHKNLKNMQGGATNQRYHLSASDVSSLRYLNKNALVVNDVVDDVITGGSAAPFSAEQGKLLANRIGELNQTIDTITTRITELSNQEIDVVDNLEDGGHDKALSAEMGKVLAQRVAEAAETGGSSVTVINALDSTDGTAALAAAQGKILSERVTILENNGEHVTVIDNFDSESATAALSAGKGKELKGLIDDLTDRVDEHDDQIATNTADIEDAKEQITILGERIQDREHNTLIGLQGGQEPENEGDDGQYYHLNEEELMSVQIMQEKGLTKDNIVNNLTSGGAEYVLSAEQGKELGNRVTALEEGGAGGGVSSHDDLEDVQGGTDGEHYHVTQAELTKIGDALTASSILNVLDSDATDSSLSAAQGKALKAEIDAIKQLFLDINPVRTFKHKITAEEAAAKSFTFTPVVKEGQESEVSLTIGGIAQGAGTDFEVSTAEGVTTLSWAGKALEEVGIVENDVFIVTYEYSL